MKTPKFLDQSVIASTLLLMFLFIIPLTMISQKSFSSKDNSSFVNQESLIIKQTGDDDDKTLSPYFFVKSESNETEQLPLKATSANVNIAGVIADVTVKQVYVNSGKNVIEAIYIFPASTRAAVYSM
ncbi:MAG TPA: VIT domain-containing protein, partial [Bacteroidales bacterium]|nr:VIT domain-containing protein [Bacteroidales bacterium]